MAERNIASFLKKHQILFVSMFLALFSLHLALTDKREIERGYVVKEILSYTATPLQKVLLGGQDVVSDVWSGYINLVGAKAQNAQLQKRVTALEEDKQRLEEELRLNSRLREILDYKEALPYSTTASGIAGFNMELWSRTVTINKGSAEGIENDRAVISPLGVVGRTISVNNHASKVLLTTDLRSNIDVLVERSRVKGVIEGDGKESLVLKYVRQVDDVEPGDRILTSGISGVFPKGLVVGEVVKIEKSRDNFFKHIEVRPRADIMRIEEVLVVKETGFYSKD